MATGCVDVRTRDTERHGKMRVDQVADMLEKLKPAPAQKETNFYEKIWDVNDYAHLPKPDAKEIVEAKTESTLFQAKEKPAPAKKEQPAKKEKA